MAKANYIDNKLLVAELLKWKKSIERVEKLKKKNPNSKARSKMSNKLGEMFELIIEGMSQRHEFRGYTYLETLKGKAKEFLVRYAYKFNHEKYTNGFGYCSQIAYNGFRQQITKEHTQANIKEKMYNDLIVNESYLNENEIDKLITNLDDKAEKILLSKNTNMLKIIHEELEKEVEKISIKKQKAKRNKK